MVASATQALTNLSSDPEYVPLIEETAGATSLIQQLISSKQSVQVGGFFFGRKEGGAFYSFFFSFALSLSHGLLFCIHY